MLNCYKDFPLFFGGFKSRPGPWGVEPDTEGMNLTQKRFMQYRPLQRLFGFLLPCLHLGGWVFQPSSSFLFFNTKKSKNDTGKTHRKWLCFGSLRSPLLVVVFYYVVSLCVPEISFFDGERSRKYIVGGFLW